MSQYRIGGPGGRRRPRPPRALRAHGRRRFCRPFVELLEDRTLLAAALAGSVFADVNGNGLQDRAEPGLAGVPVSLHLNGTTAGSGVVNGADVTYASATAPPGQSLPLDNVGISVTDVPINVSGLPDQFQHLRVGLDVTNDTGDTVLAFLASPAGVNAGGVGPNLVYFAPYQHFDGTFDDQAPQRVGGAQAAIAPGTAAALSQLAGRFQADQLFGDPNTPFVYGNNPDGGWLLFFVDFPGSDLTGDINSFNLGAVPAGFTLNSWSLTFSTSTTTDANGAYSFTGVAPGAYDVTAALPPGDVQTTPAPHVTLAAGQSLSGLDFGARPAPDLAGVSFQVLTPPTDWGQPVTVRYTVANQGLGAAGPFDMDLRLSPDGTIRPGSLPLDTVHLGGLAAGASASGTLTVNLPGSPGRPPGGFDRLDGSFLGLLIDPANAVAETNEANNTNQGAGIDEAPLVAPQDQALTTSPGVQQQPSVAVDPHDPDRVAVAYMDYNLLKDGYAGIAVASSSDGGTTWQHATVPLPAGFDGAAGYPALRFDDQGHLFVSFMAATFLGNKPPIIYPRGTDPNNGNAQFTSYTFTADNGIFVARSDDGGATWGTPSAVVAHLYTGTPVLAENIPDLAVDTFRTLPDGSANPNYGNVYVTWTRAYPPGQFPGEPGATGGSDVMLAVSTNGGQSWTTRLQNGVTVLQDPANNGAVASGNGSVDFSHVSVGRLGDVYVSAFVGGAFWVFHSTDAGRSFAIPFNSAGLGLIHGIPFTFNFPSPTLPTNGFRTLPARQIAADPSRPGVVYAVEEVQTEPTNPSDPNNRDLIAFARSDDGGENWQIVAPLTGSNSVLNAADQPSPGEALPHLAVDENGDIAIIWYDTRDDPTGHDVDVFGSVSTDGGQTFSAPFRLTSTSFDANEGVFTDALHQPDSFLGDATGLALADGTAYAAWTDTRDGNQDIHVERFAVPPGPAPLGDRFEPNNTPATATELGAVLARRVVPALTLTPGDDDWYRVEPSSGTLSVATSGAATGQRLVLELYDATGTQLLATGTDILNTAGQVTGEQLGFDTQPGQAYLIHVAGVPPDSAQAATYSLVLQSLTGDLGAAAHIVQSGSLVAGGQDTYLLTAPVAGTLTVTASAEAGFGGPISLDILNANGVSLLPARQTGNASVSASVAVSAGEVVLLQVAGGTNAHNAYTLGATNFDQFEATQARTLFYPTQGTPTALAAADLNGDGHPDLVAANPNTADGVDVLLGNADGTFQASRGFDAGPGGVTRGLAVADLNKDGVPDVAVTDYNGDGVSVLLGNGDGTLQPDRPFDATLHPDAVVVGDFNGDGIPDLAVLQRDQPVVGSQPNGAPGADIPPAEEQVAILIGRGDGTYKPPAFRPTTFTQGAGTLLVGDFNGDGRDDLAAFSFNDPTADLFLGNGDGTFAAARTFQTGESVATARAVDLGNGALDLITSGTVDAVVNVLVNDGHGNFGAPQTFLANPDQRGIAQAINGLTVADVTGAAGGGPDGHMDLVLTAQPRNGTDSPQLIVLPGLVDAGGHFAGFGTPRPLAVGPFTGPLAVGDFNGDKVPDIAAAVPGGVEVFYGKPLTLTPNATEDTARDLGTVVHYVSPTQAVVPGHEDAWFKLTVPTETVPGSGPEVIDFSAAFANDPKAAGLSMEVLDAAGNVLQSGRRFRVVANQGQVLFLHVFGIGGNGTGTYTLDVDVLPQVVSVDAESFLPGGPTTSLVLTLQGDRLDPATAEIPTNYRVTWLGPDGTPGTADDQVIPLRIGSAGSPPVVYDPSANVDVSTGARYPTAVRQTITLQFDQPLPAGPYEIELSDGIQTAAFTAGEAGLLAGDNSLTDAATFAGHPLASVVGGQAVTGSSLVVNGRVPAAGTGGDLSAFADGTSFLGQLHDDLGTVLTDALSDAGDTANTTAVLQEIIDRVGPGVGDAGQRSTMSMSLTDDIRSAMKSFAIPVAPTSGTSFVVIWLDPVSVNLADPAGERVQYDLQQDSLTNDIGNAFVSVAGNIEVLVLPTHGGTFSLNLADVVPQARGGVVVFNVNGPEAAVPELSSPAAGAEAGAAPGATVSSGAIDLAAVFGSLTTGVVVDITPTELAAAAAAQPGAPSLAGAATAVRGNAVAAIDGGQAVADSDVARVLRDVVVQLAPLVGGGGGSGWRQAVGGLRRLLDGSVAALRAALRRFGLTQLPVVHVAWQEVWDVARGVVLDTVRELRAGLPRPPRGVTDPAVPVPAEPERAIPAPTPNQGALPPAEGPRPVEGLGIGRASLAAALFALGLARPWVRDWVAARRPGTRKRRRAETGDSPEGAA